MIKQLCMLCCILLVGSCSQKQMDYEHSLSLQEVYGEAFLIGVAINSKISSGRDSATQALVLQQFNSVTPGNVMKASPINPKPGIYNFGPADDFVEFGEKNNMFMVGHTLVWHNQTPAWFFHDEAGNPNSHEAQVERMRMHIETVAGRYAGKVHAWM